MTKRLPLMILTAAAMFSGVAGAATRTTPAPAKPATAVKASRTMHAVTTTRTTAPAGRMVATKTSTGKAITYNCSKAGNASKKACK